jgi:hypothetical protein
MDYADSDQLLGFVRTNSSLEIYDEDGNWTDAMGQTRKYYEPYHFEIAVKMIDGENLATVEARSKPANQLAFFYTDEFREKIKREERWVEYIDWQSQAIRYWNSATGAMVNEKPAGFVKYLIGKPFFVKKTTESMQKNIASYDHQKERMGASPSYAFQEYSAKAKPIRYYDHLKDGIPVWKMRNGSFTYDQPKSLVQILRDDLGYTDGWRQATCQGKPCWVNDALRKKRSSMPESLQKAFGLPFTQTRRSNTPLPASRLNTPLSQTRRSNAPSPNAKSLETRFDILRTKILTETKNRSYAEKRLANLETIVRLRIQFEKKKAERLADSRKQALAKPFQIPDLGLQQVQSQFSEEMKQTVLKGYGEEKQNTMLKIALKYSLEKLEQERKAAKVTFVQTQQALRQMEQERLTLLQELPKKAPNTLQGPKKFFKTLTKKRPNLTSKEISHLPSITNSNLTAEEEHELIKV